MKKVKTGKKISIHLLPILQKMKKVNEKGYVFVKALYSVLFEKNNEGKCAII